MLLLLLTLFLSFYSWANCIAGSSVLLEQIGLAEHSLCGRDEKIDIFVVCFCAFIALARHCFDRFRAQRECTMKLFAWRWNRDHMQCMMHWPYRKREVISVSPDRKALLTIRYCSYPKFVSSNLCFQRFLRSSSLFEITGLTGQH